MGPTKKRPSQRLRAYAGPRSVFCDVNSTDFYYGPHASKIFSKLETRLPSGPLFERDFYECILEKRSDHFGALAALGQLYTELGEYEKGLQLDKRLVALRPDSAIAYYNLSCSYSLLEMAGKAFEQLRKAIELGYEDWDHLQNDDDMTHLRADARFDEIMNEVRGRKLSKG